MKKLAALICLGSLAFTAASCDEAPPPQPAKKASTCDISLDNLAGEWVKIIPTAKGDVLDERNRVKFYTENGTPKMLATMGTIDKRVFVQAEKRTRDVIYLQERDPEIIAKVKAENKDPNFRLQAKMYVRVNEKKCKPQITEAYITYVNGELQEPGTGGAVWYAKTDKTYSWENCTDPRSLKFSEEPVDTSKVRAAGKNDRPLLRAIPAGKKGYFYTYIPDSDFKEGCTSSFDVYDEDVRVETGLTNLMAASGGKVFLFDRTFEPADTGRYIEVFRYETCGAKKDLASVSCGVVKPE